MCSTTYKASATTTTAATTTTSTTTTSTTTTMTAAYSTMTTSSMVATSLHSWDRTCLACSHLKTTHFQQQKRTHSSKSSRKLSVIWKIKYIAIEEDSLTLSVELSYRPGCQKVLLLLSHSEKHESQVNQTYMRHQRHFLARAVLQ